MTGPAWSAAFDDERLARVRALPLPVAREWAFGGSTGAGVKVAVVDSGVDAGHPQVGGLAGAVAVESAPDAALFSVRVLGAYLKGSGALFHAGIRWAVEHGMAVVNLSLSSKSQAMFAPLHDIADRAYFGRTLLVSAANNQPGPTYPSQYASVVSVAARSGTDPWALAYNPRPPVEFGARGIDLEVAWADGGSTVASGNSFAAPHVAGMAAVLLAKHPGLVPFQVKAVLQAVSDNAEPHEKSSRCVSDPTEPTDRPVQHGRIGSPRPTK